MILFVYRHRFSGGEKEKKSSVSIIQTKPSEMKEKVAPAIQPSKTYKTNSEEETKKQVKGTKVVVNSVIEQNVINSSEDNGLRTAKNQVRLMLIFFVNIKNISCNINRMNISKSRFISYFDIDESCILYVCAYVFAGAKDSNSSDDKKSCSFLASANKVEG